MEFKNLKQGRRFDNEIKDSLQKQERQSTMDIYTLTNTENITEESHEYDALPTRASYKEIYEKLKKKLVFITFVIQVILILAVVTLAVLHAANIPKSSQTDGTWNGWGSWSECSSTCGYGMELRERNCSDKTGHLCHGSSTGYQICKMANCPENNGTWGGWGFWSECSSTCGYGMERRERNCSDKTGHLCYGDTTEYQICKTANCPDCEAIYGNGTRSDGVYDISPYGLESFPVYCDMTNGGWTLIQNRINDSVLFNRTWSEYETGFGDLRGSHWLGLEKIHRLTKNGSQIRFDMELIDASKVYAQYKSFRVDDAATAYTMHVNISGYIGSIPELLSYHDGMKFYTFDRDNRCPNVTGYAGWWFNDCYRLGNLNGPYGIHQSKGLAYYDGGGYWYPRTSSIKVKVF